MALPTIHGIWRAGTDSELRYSPSGIAVCSFRAVASASKFNETTKEWEDNGEIWVTVTCFRNLAEHVAETVTKGVQMAILGKIVNEPWETRDGEKRETLKVLADAVSVIPKKDDQPARSQPATQAGEAGDPWAPAPQTDEPPF